MTSATAVKLVRENIAERSGPKEISLKGSVIPEHHELLADTAHWAGVANSSPALSEEKQKFLRFMKGLAG